MTFQATQASPMATNSSCPAVPVSGDSVVKVNCLVVIATKLHSHFGILYQVIQETHQCWMEMSMSHRVPTACLGHALFVGHQCSYVGELPHHKVMTRKGSNCTSNSGSFWETWGCGTTPHTWAGRDWWHAQMMQWRICKCVHNRLHLRNFNKKAYWLCILTPIQWAFLIQTRGHLLCNKIVIYVMS